ncbi:MAG: restriction endonuclease subunit S [Bacteroidia bacterium]|nr:restriction endonuclease subunit S [Bacteroidia bacterium]MCO5254380.1 restriction endonuclease subunit S [Bacteroidota bacterium]
MTDWKTYRLGEFTDINPRVTLKQGNEYSFIEMKDLNATFKYVSPSAKRELKGGSKFQNGDTLFARITPCLENGKICQVKKLENNVGFGSTEFLVFRGKENVSDNDFVYYLSRSEFVKNNAVQMMTGTSGRQRVEKSALEQLEITTPDLPTQRQIAQILTSLDDKIELNLQMNQTLEAMAQAIFKEWCTTENDEIPDGWNVKELADLADVSSSKRIFREEYTLSGVPFYRGKEVTQLSNGESISTELFISNERYEEIKEKFGVPQVGEILITSVGTIGSIWLVDNDSPFYFKDGNVTWIKNYKTQVSGEFIYQWLKTKDAQEQIKSVTIGSTQQALTISALKGLKILIPDEQTVIGVVEQLGKINAKRINNTNQIHSLAQTRETLLPKLMSGQLEVV